MNIWYAKPCFYVKLWFDNQEVIIISPQRLPGLVQVHGVTDKYAHTLAASKAIARDIHTEVWKYW